MKIGWKPFSLIFSTLVLSSYLGKDIVDFNLGYYVDKATIYENDHIYYRLIVDDLYQPGQDIIIKAIPLDEVSDPDIYISKTVQNPNSSADSDWQCASYGRDTCTIHHSDIKRGDNFYIGIVCPNGVCNIQIITMTSDEFVLEDGIEFQTYLVENEARIFKFIIPGNIEDDDHIIVKGSSFSGNAHDFSLSVTTDTDNEHELPSSSLSNKKSISAWKKGQVIRLNRENFPKSQWCKGCELKILVDVRDAGYYHIMVQTTESVPKVHNNDQIDDIVGFDQVQCYQYYIKSENTDFQITLTTYTGRVQFKYNPGAIPDYWEDFKGKPDQDQEIIVDIRPRYRQHHMNQTKGTYYFCVKGELTSTYSLKAREFEQDWTNSIIEDGYSEMFGLFPNGFQTHLYRVPKLDYTGEDIKIEFDLMVKRGQEPILAVAFCALNSTEDCKRQATLEEINKPDSNYKKAISIGQILKLVIDHDESKCQELFNGENCYYVVAVHNDNDKWCRYKLQASHNQNNHILLQERTPKVDSVKIQTYKYYKFTITEQDKQNISNVSFEINPLHGDSDLIVARNNSFPTKEVYEKKSSRVGSLVDHVTYSKDEDTDNLAGTYYVAIYGYTYSTYSIIVNVNRTKHDKIDDSYSQSVLLYQGIPITKTLLHSNQQLHAFFTVQIDENESPSIMIGTQQLNNNVLTYIKYGDMPTENSYDFKISGTNQIEIKSSSKKYHQNGSYFILVIPDPGLFDLVFDNEYSFSLIWRTEDTFPHLNSQGLQQVITAANSFSYLRHFILDNTQDIKLSLITTGHQDIFVSANPNNKNPTNETADFTTKYQTGSNFAKGKTLLIPMKLVINKNPSCKDLGYAEEDPCVIYIGIYCQEAKGCNSQIELEYDTQSPKRLYSGQQKHTIMSNESFATYYININRDNITDVFAVLQTLSGNSYVNYNIQRFQDNSIQNVKDSKSKTKLNSQILHVKKADIEQFFELAQNDTSQDNDECQIVFKIYPTAENKEINLIYNFAVYKNMIEIQNKQPVFGYVGIDDYQYFLYKEECVNCSMLISLTGQLNDGILLFINKGTKLPTRQENDMSKVIGSSQIITLNLQDTPLFKDKNLKSMEGYYIIGVYGTKQSSFQLSITSEEQPIVTISHGMPVRHTQKAKEIIYYQYYHWSQNDIEIQLQVQQGSVDLLVQTFNPQLDNFVNKMPITTRNSLWSVENMNSTNVISGQELVILKQDANFCSDCYYLIAAKTNSENAMYTLEVKSIDASQVYTNLLRVGDNKMVNIIGTRKKAIYQFILESNDPASIVPTVITGEVKYYLGFTEDTFTAFYTQSSNLPINILDVSPNQTIQEDKNYYLIIVSQSPSVELSLNLQQKFSYINLFDGIPQSVYFQNKYDIIKYLQFNMPIGNYTIMITVKSKTQQFYPLLTTYLSKQNETTVQSGYNKIFNFPAIWDKDQYVCQLARKYENIQEGSQLRIVLKYAKGPYTGVDEQDNSDTSGLAVVTLSYSQLVKLTPNEEYYGQMMTNSYSFIMFMIQPPKNQTTEISFSNCVGQSTMSLIKRNSSTELDVENHIPIDINNQNGQQIAQIKNLDGSYYILVESISLPSQNENSNLNPFERNSFSNEFTIKVQYYIGKTNAFQVSYQPEDGGHINFEPLRDKRGQVKFSWNPIYMQTRAHQTEELQNVRYKLVYSLNPHVNLDQVCSLKRRKDVRQVDLNGTDVLEAYQNIEPNTALQFNVIAVIEEKQIAIPYKPISINIPSRQAHGGKLLITVVAVVFMLSAAAALYFFFKNRRLQNKLRTELRDVYGGSSGVTETYRKVDGANFNAVENE